MTTIQVRHVPAETHAVLRRVLVSALADDDVDGDLARGRLPADPDLHAPSLVDLEVLSVLRRRTATPHFRRSCCGFTAVNPLTRRSAVAALGALTGQVVYRLVDALVGDRVEGAQLLGEVADPQLLDHPADPLRLRPVAEPVA